MSPAKLSDGQLRMAYRQSRVQALAPKDRDMVERRYALQAEMVRRGFLIQDGEDASGYREVYTS